ncbi:MAG: F0F1 ATP synthase subunit alpha [Bryobacteraceae bacterium]
MKREGSLHTVFEETLGAVDRISRTPRGTLRAEEYGEVTSVGHGVARVRGLPGVRSEELVRFPNDLLGMAFNLEPEEVGVILLDEGPGLAAGATARRTNRVLDVPVGEGLLGRVVDPAGRPLDNAGRIRSAARAIIESPAPAIIDRAPVTVPLSTGIKVVDALIPIGRGQRELILGDRQTGKTGLVVDCMINQKGKHMICIYCAIGQRSSSVAKVIADLREHDATSYCIVVFAPGDAPPGQLFIAPYAAMAMGEYFMRKGLDALVVFDDLSQHARAYRELSLLLRRPPGRESFPGDIFYIHSRLLERSTHFRPELGGGSLSALPIIETEEQNLAAYIPTNLISITDGQIYLTPTLFQKGVLPAVDVGTSVSRVGGKTQLPAYRAVAADLKLSYSQFEELEVFSRFGTRIDEHTRRTLARGRAVREALKQPLYDPLPAAEQIAILLAATSGLFDDLPPEKVAAFSGGIRRLLPVEMPGIYDLVDSGKDLDAASREALIAVARKALNGEWKPLKP